MQDLQEVTQEIHYENFRSERIASGSAITRKIKYANEMISHSSASVYNGSLTLKFTALTCIVI